jgi:hypothetical protein
MAVSPNKRNKIKAKPTTHRGDDGYSAEPAKPYEERLAALRTEREEYKTVWQDIQRYVLPRKGFFTDRGDEVKKKRDHNAILDPEATFDLKDLAAGLLAGMTPKSRPWLRLTLQDDAMMEFTPVREWMHMAGMKMLDVFAWSNLYATLHAIYKEVAGFGTAAMMQEDDNDSFIRFRTFPAGTYYLGVNERGDVDTFYRKFPLSARNIVSTFGYDKVPDEIIDAANKASTSEKFYDICHAIQPNGEFDDRKIDNRRGKRVESTYWVSGKTQELLKKSGYDDFPIFCPRWDVVGTMSAYGESPSMDVLGHIKMLQEMNDSQIRAVHQESRPAMRVPASFKGRLSLIPGAQNIDPDPGGKGISRLFDMRFDYMGVTEKIRDVREQLKRAYFVDLFKMLALSGGVQPKTATEIAERHEEKMILLSPVIERFDVELLNPMVRRTFNKMVRAGMLPPPPPEIEGQPMKVEYSSILAQAQKRMGLQSIDTFLGFVVGAAGTWPQVVDKVDADEMVDQYADATGTPPKIILSDDKVRKVREEKRRQAEEAAMMEQLASGAGIAKDLASAKTDEGNALTDVAAAMTGGGLS